MGGENPRNVISNAPDSPAHAPAGPAPVNYRRIFREMVKGETEDGPLTPFQRRQLVRFARRLNIPRRDARLMVRAIEYERGQATIDELAEAAGLSRRCPRRWIIELEFVLRLGLLVLAVLLNVLAFRWFMRMAL